MPRHLPKCALVLLCVINATSGLRAVEPRNLGPSVYDELERKLDAAQFVSIDDATFQRSLDELLVALQKAPQAIEKDDWNYLRTQAVADALTSGSENQQAILANLIDKLNQDFSPYENPDLLELRRLARRHRLYLERRERNDAIEDNFQREKTSLKQAIAQFQETGERDAYRRIASGIRWLDENQLANKFVDAAKQRLSHPNLEVKLPASVLRSVTMTQLPTQTEPIDRTSDGIRTRGTGVVTSRAYLAPAASARSANFLLQFSGEFLLNATNTRQRIQFRSQATTRTTGVAAISLSNTGDFSINGLRVCATSRLCNSRACVNRRIGRRVIGRVVDRVIEEKKPEIELALSRELQERVQEELGTQLTELADQANSVIEDRMRAPARRLDLTPREFSVVTQTDGVRLSLLEDQQCGLAAANPFSGDFSQVGVVALHSSLATDLLNSLYVRRKSPRELDGDLMQRLNTSLPFQMFDEVDFPDETRLTFELEFPRPFQVTFDSDVIEITLRGSRIVLDDDSFTGRDLSIRYRVFAGPDSQINFELLGTPQLSASSDEGLPPELTKLVSHELLAGLRPAFTLDVNGMLNNEVSLPFRLVDVASDEQWLVLSLDANPEKSGSLLASKK